MSQIVLGGGLAGLSAAYYMLRRFGKPTTVLEASGRVGGWLRTETHEEKGFIFEFGPHTIRPKGLVGKNTLSLIEDLKLPVEGIPSDHPAARNRMIYAKGQLCMLPNSLRGIFMKQPPFTKPLVNAIFHDILAGKKISKIGDESIYDFTERRFGREIADYAIGSMICGICAGDAKNISVRFLMNELYEKEQKWGGVIKGMLISSFSERKKNLNTPGLFAGGDGGSETPVLYEKAMREKWSMYSLKGGIEVLPRKLSHYLRKQGTKLLVCSECNKIRFTADGAIISTKTRNIETDHVVAAIPSFKLAPCVKEHHPSLAALLAAIEYVDVAVVNLQYTGNRILKQKAFGFLVPPIEQLPILGIIFDSCCFDMHGNTVLTVMMGGKWFEQHFGSSPSQRTLFDTATRHINKILGIQQEPKIVRINVLKKCIPQYTVGHRQRVADIRRYIKDHNLAMSVCGAAYDGVGINDVIMSARNQVELLNPESYSE